MKHKVTIYTTSTCTFCKQAKAFFKEHKIDYKEIDVGSNQKAAEEMVEKSGQMGVPVIEIDDTIIIGFDREALMKELEIK
ncbi:glutathione S-transferase N-terminal domain-containing protein [Candidatus Woesearchaeota archaeon]|nr:glutathione S-transferase N-terminal domain-containing protein [Candidatus Woesearchaeota archaeon]